MNTDYASPSIHWSSLRSKQLMLPAFQDGQMFLPASIAESYFVQRAVTVASSPAVVFVAAMVANFGIRPKLPDWFFAHRGSSFGIAHARGQRKRPQDTAAGLPPPWHSNIMDTALT